ncbi:tagaturonate reductase [Deltaproteobacteria bacterium Smac51]|nr:tagaturonate reductase [Deltaproteobacteria bacterium Smac51]
MRKVNETLDGQRKLFPEKVLQFGEGNFLRGFADWMIHLANDQGLFSGSVVLCQPSSKDSRKADLINSQKGVYTLVMRGQENGRVVERVEKISSVSRCLNLFRDFAAFLDLAASPLLKIIISNTTEAGITFVSADQPGDRPPSSYPAKLTIFLYERFKKLGDVEAAELLVLPTELIDDNGALLKNYILRHSADWNYEKEFFTWLERRIHFANTLVDRIVTGHPAGEMDALQARLGYRDDLLVAAEPYNLWVIEGRTEWADFLPIDRTEANVIWTDNVAPYKKRKVRILNGAHTSTVPAAYLAGFDIVRDFMHDDIFRQYLEKIIHTEIIPTLEQPRKELEKFAASVADRFDNPYIDHRLLDIGLNTSAKFPARCLPSLLEYMEIKGSVPPLLSFSLAAYLAFYKCDKRDDGYFGRQPDGQSYQLRDDQSALDLFASAWAEGDAEKAATRLLSAKQLWDGRDLTAFPELAEKVIVHLKNIETAANIKEVIANLLRGGQ